MGADKRAALVAARRGAHHPLFPKVFHDVVDQLQHVVGGELGAAGGGFAAELGPVLARKDEEWHLVPAFPDHLKQFVSGSHFEPRPHGITNVIRVPRRNHGALRATSFCLFFL